MLDGIILRLPTHNVLLYRKNENLYLSAPDKSGSRLILGNCGESYDAAVTADGNVFIVCRNDADVFLCVCSGDEINAERLELPEDSANFRLHLIGRVLSLGFTAPIGGGRQGLYHCLPQSSKVPELIGRCSSSARPFSSAADIYGNILFAYATHDGCVNGVGYIWGKKNFGKHFLIGEHSILATSPHIMMEGERLHCTYVAKDSEGSKLMYYNDNISISELLYEGCYTGALPVMLRVKEQVCVMWNQYGNAMLTDTWHKKFTELEGKRYLAEPSFIGIRLPEPIGGYNCSEVYARDSEEGFRPLAVSGILDVDISALTRKKIIIPGQEAEQLFASSGFVPEQEQAVEETYIAQQPAPEPEISEQESIPEQSVPEYDPQSEIQKLIARVELLEDVIKNITQKAEQLQEQPPQSQGDTTKKSAPKTKKPKNTQSKVASVEINTPQNEQKPPRKTRKTKKDTPSSNL